MNNKSSRELYVRKVLDAIPANIKPVDYLMDILNISRESVYRRIKCKVPFTYDEMVKLSSKLSFSIDEVIPLTVNNRAVFSYQEHSNNPLNFFQMVLKGYEESVTIELKAENRMSIAAVNHLWLVHVLGYDNLLKFYYYKWIHQMYMTPLKIDYSNLVIPQQIYDLSHKILEQIRFLKNSVFILDKCVFYNVINELQYYHRRKLIDDNDMQLIKKDIESLITVTENNILNGYNEDGSTRMYYLCSLNIYSNSLYLEYDGNISSFFYEYSIRPMGTTSAEVCVYHKKWLDSLKKFSISVSASNEELQMEFFSKQRVYLDTLGKGDLVYP